jgi:hypothetical protein
VLFLDTTKYFAWVNLVAVLIVVGLLVAGDALLFVLSYIALFIFICVRTLMQTERKRHKFYMLIAYLAVMILQICIAQELLHGESETWRQIAIPRTFAAIILLLPLAVSRYISTGKYSQFYLPSLREAATIGFSDLHDSMSVVNKAISKMGQAGKSMSPHILMELITDMPRYDSFHYINNDSLTEAYFEEVEKTFDDENMYIVISNTGSPASELISVFTQTQYNHASLAFDEKLRTIISYNGGERVYPPGLNQEMLKFFMKKPDASILVYSLPATRQQKEMILEKIREINREGSAYNMVGLLLKYSHKPNIMFCSQFVFNMLQYAGLAYFTKPDGKVSPINLIELDYHKKLRFLYEIRFNTGS